MSFSPQWESMFSTPTNPQTAAQSRLGIDFIAASAPETTVGQGLAVQQDLNRLGIAGVVWNCARVLIKFLEANPKFVTDRHVLELGAGTGAVGLAIALSCRPLQLVITDLPEVVEQLTQRNLTAAAETHIRLSEMIFEGRLAATAHDWGSTPTTHIINAQVILCSDCLYDPRGYEPLLATLQAVRLATVFLAYKQRHYEREREFFDAAAEHFDVTVWSETSGEATPFGGEAIFICCLRSKTTEPRR